MSLAIFFAHDFFPRPNKPFELPLYVEAMAIASASQSISEFAPHHKVLDPCALVNLDLTLVEFNGEMSHSKHSCSSILHSMSFSSVDSTDVFV